MKRILCLLMALPLMLSSAAPAEEAPGTYALVVKDTVNPYMQKMYEGFSSACAELGVTPVLVGSDKVDNRAQAALIDQLIGQRIQALAIASSDGADVTAPLKRALDAGIQVVSVDSAVDPACRKTHIQQADPQIVARALMQAAHRMIGGVGQAAILSTSPSMPNQATWVSLMREEFVSHPEAYAEMQIVEVAYGNDEREGSRAETERLLDQYPDLKILIAPTTVGIRAAAEVISARESKVLLTGLGLPSDMESFVTGGVCPWMYLWNPIDTGYLAAYALDALEDGQILGEAGETFGAGRFGEKVITPGLDGGTEVVLGNPYKFDSGNILSWKNVF